MCLRNSITPQPIALRELLMPSKDLVIESAKKEIFWFCVSGFFVSDVISGVGFLPFWLMLPGLWPNC